MERVLTTMRKGDAVLGAIDGLSQNDITILQLIKSERMSFLDLNATAHGQLGIDYALDIIGKLTNLGLIIELTDRPVRGVK